MNTKSKISGVSIGIKMTSLALSEDSNLKTKINTSGFTVKIANTLEEREAVFKLGYQEYLKKGFINECSQEWLVRNYDIDPETIILVVKDKQNRIVGSVTLVFDLASKLPAEKIFSRDLSLLRQSGETIVEISRLVIDPQYRNSKEILVLLFNYLYIYSYKVKKYTSLIIEVNPRHKVFYQEIFHFNQIGIERACPSVQNSPATLMHLSLQKSRKTLIQIQNKQWNKERSRSLFQFFVNINQENLVAHYLEKQVKPMNSVEKSYFGFSESGTSKAICV